MTQVRKVTLRTVGDAWKACVPFDANGTLTGRYTEWPESGRLNEDETSELRRWADSASLNPAARLFVVYSYATPIAWAIVYNDGRTERYKVAQRFSVTTSKHSGRLGIN
jgi:hypothetical protein